MTSSPPSPYDENNIPAYRPELPPAPRRSGVPADLVREYYPGLFRFGAAALGAADAARLTALHTLAIACHRRSALAAGGRLWLYNSALREFRRLATARMDVLAHPDAPATTVAIGYEAAVRKLVDRWDEQERQTAVLYYLLRWPTAEIAALLKVSASAVQAQVELFRHAFAALPEAGAVSAEQPATQRISAPDQPALNPAETRAAAYLQTRWPTPVLSEDEVFALAEQVDALCAAIASPGGRVAAPWLKWGAGGLLLIVLIAGAVGLLWNFGRRGSKQNPPTQTKTSADFSQPTPFPPTPQAPLLSRQSARIDILQRWQISRNLWHSLVIDVQSIDYGSPSYIGPPRRYRSQGWALQPDSGIQLIGLLSQPAGQVDLVGSGRIFTRSYISGRSSSRAWTSRDDVLLPEDPLHSMVFPSTSPWAERDGSFWWAASTEMLGRRVEIFDWLNHLNQPEARLYLDAHTGMILREQVYTGGEFEILLRENVVTELQFERREPPPALIVAAQQSQAPEADANTGFLPLQATPTPAMQATPRPSLPFDPPPPGMDPSRSKLYFQFADDPTIAERLVNTADTPAMLFADGYFLGETRFGLPWALRCTRSQDGGRLAFNTASDGASPPDDGLHWFHLSAPGRIYQPMPGFHTEAFAFSPDARSLGAAGFYNTTGNGQNARKNGLYRVDLALGEAELLIEVNEARSLVWSPDGKFLALIGRLPNEDQPTVLVVNVGAHLVIYQGEPSDIDGPPPANSPIPGWNVAFPVNMGDLETCAAPLP